MAFKWDSKKPAEEIDQRFVRWAKRLVEDGSVGLGNSGDERQDANETLFFARQLEYIYAQTYDIQYPELKARKLIPVDGSVPTGAETFTYRSFDKRGIAKMISDYADDLPDVTLLGQEFNGKCKSMGVAYSYSIQDIRRAQMVNRPLESDLAEAARYQMELKIDEIAAFGDKATGLPGFLNNANVPLVTVITGSWDSYPTTTAVQILADLNKLANAPFNTTNEIEKPDTLVLDTTMFSLLSTTPMSASFPNESILDYFVKHSPFIKQVESWYRLGKADANGTKPRAMVYTRDPRKLGLVISQEFEQFPPQPKSLGFKTPCHARTGGMKWTYPLSAAYMDGIHS
jgi:hypothetical protein